MDPEAASALDTRGAIPDEPVSTAGACDRRLRGSRCFVRSMVAEHFDAHRLRVTDLTFSLQADFDALED